MSDKQVTLSIDGSSITVPEGTLVIRAAEQLGIYVPRFCDHPYLAPLGACRQCMVEVEGQRKPLTSCTTTCTEGMIVKTQATSSIAKGAQEGVLEFLLINHPLDCPMCDKGGECPLQDQTLAYGPGASRMIDSKRRYLKPVPVNELVYLDRERCVLCARCTRFSSEISGDPFIELFERGALEQVAIFEDDPYESNFSGNIIQICPVGALTSKDFRFKARPFDMTSTQSTCAQCASGCAITVQERRGNIVRVLAADDKDVNDEWSCDKGRFGHAYVRSPERISEPMVRKNGELVAVSWAEAIRVTAEAVTVAKAEGSKIGVLSGCNLLDEDAFALSLFARNVLETNDVDTTLGISWPEGFVEALLDAEPATNAHIDSASTIVVAGVDLYEESPIVFLRVRKAARRGARVIEIGPRASTLPGEKLLVSMSSIPAALETVQAGPGSTVVLAGERLAFVPGALASVWNAAAGTNASFGLIPRKAGTIGALQAGLYPRSGARDATSMLTNPGGGLLFVLGADPLRDLSASRVSMLGKSEANIISIDLLPNETTKLARIVLPACSAIERDGTITNWERRARPVHRALEPAGLSVPDWEILSRIAHELGIEFPRTLGEIRGRMTATKPRGEMRPIPVAGSTPAVSFPDEFDKVSYRLLLDQGTMMAGANDLRAATLDPFVEMSVIDAERKGFQDGDSVRVSTQGRSFDLALKVSRKIAPGCVFIPSDQPGAFIGDESASVRIEKR
ncbi:MAG: NADH-quinone oxidoreductase subunit NuoG [Actinomycetota bacterium]